MIHDFLSDRWEGMAGTYLGKDYSSISELFKIFEVENKKEDLYFIKLIESKNTKATNAELERKRKAAERAKQTGTNIRKK